MNIAVIGAGAAGMMAAIAAAEQGGAVTVFERNPRPGMKINITGKGRCNLTNDCSVQDLIRNTPPNESLVDTPYGRGTVLDTSLLRGTCKVRMMNNPDAPVTVPCDQCTVLRRGRDKGEPLPDLPAPPPAKPLPSREVHLVDSVEQSAEEKPQGEHKGQRRNDRPRRNDRDKAKPQGEQKPRGDKPRNDKPKKDKPQGEPKPAEGQQPAKEGGDQHKRRNHRGGRRNHRGGGKGQGDKAQAPKTE